MPAMSARPILPMGYYGQGSQFPFMPNPNWMTEREQMLQQQLLQERQHMEAWRAGQAQPQPQPPISSSGLPPKVGDNVDIYVERSASTKRARPEDLKTRPQAPYQLSGAQSGNLCPIALGSSAPGPPGYGHHRQFDSSFNKQGRTRSPTLLRLTVDLFLWLEAQNIIVRARHISGCLNVIADHLLIRISPYRQSGPSTLDRETYLQGLGDTRSRHVCNSVELPPSSVHVSNSGAKSPSGGCSVSGLAGEVNVHVSSIPPAQQSHSEASIHSGGGGNSHSPLVAESWFPHLLRLCVEHPLAFPYR